MKTKFILRIGEFGTDKRKEFVKKLVDYEIEFETRCFNKKIIIRHLTSGTYGNIMAIIDTLKMKGEM